MRLFINGEKVWEGKPDKLQLRVEMDGDEEYGPSNIGVYGGHVILNGVRGEAALTITAHPPALGFGIVVNGHAPDDAVSIFYNPQCEQADMPLIVSR